MCAERNIEIAVSYVRDIHDSKVIHSKSAHLASHSRILIVFLLYQNTDFGTRMVMIPACGKQADVVETTKLHRCNSSRNLHGNENNSESEKEPRKITVNELIAQNDDSTQSEGSRYMIVEGPIDLSASNSIKAEPDSEVCESDNLVAVKLEETVTDEEKKQKRQRKRKSAIMTPEEEWSVKYLSDRIPRQTVSKKEEVLKAARSLFSKRTRTLYHWMYPNTSKGQLKAIVSAAWDTLSSAEKEFYVSQVLGRFGVPAGSLMVNPQLEGFQNRDTTMTSHKDLLLSARDASCSSHDMIPILPSGTQDGDSFKKRWRRHGDNGSKQNQFVNDVGDVSYDEEEFADDPELKTELLQFKRAMGNSSD